VTVQILRDWMVLSNDSGQDRLIDSKAAGKPCLLSDDQRAALAQLRTMLENARSA